MATTLSPDSIERFLRSLAENGRSQNTIRAYRADLMALLDSETPCGDGIETRAKTHLNRIRFQTKPKTLERKRTAYRAWARWAGVGEILGDYKAPKSHKPIPHPLPEGIDGVLAMIDACGDNTRYKALVALCGLCGLRVGEAISVTPENIDWADSTIRLRGKGDVERIVPISRLAWHHLSRAYASAAWRSKPTDWVPLVGLKDRQARAVITKLAEKASLSRAVKSHDLRATLATAAYEKSKDLRAVQEILGHASSRTTEVYVGASMKSMRAAVEVA